MSGCFASSRSGWQEICAYGTAVKIRPLTDPTALHTTTSAEDSGRGVLPVAAGGRPARIAALTVFCA
jgi:hypothetical protein